MGLSFTSIPDREGAALYILHDGTELQNRKWQRFADDVQAETKAQVVITSIKEQDGEKIRDFYDLDIMSLPHILVVRDTDELAQIWSGQYAPQVSDVTYALNQVGV